MAVAPPRTEYVLLRDLAIALVVGVAAGILLAFVKLWFPGTRPFSLEIEAAIVLLVAILVARALTNTLGTELAGISLPRHSTALNLFIYAVVAVGAIFALFELYGVGIESIFVGSAFAGIVIGFASQALLSNVFAGLTIVFARPFHVGDRIGLVSASYGVISPSYPHEQEYPTYVGTVRDIGLLYTTLFLDSGTIAAIPNSLVIGALVVDLTQQPLHAQRVRMTLALGVDVGVVESILPDLAKAVGATATAPPPVVQVANISEETWDAIVVVWTAESNESRIRDLVLRLVLRRLGPPAKGARASASG